ncbi:hypothetical protein TCAL_04173 [Tigriopus californicus]|uniref:NADH dehydrogenase [ubiquinone] 1 alpha subcomplex assembly factor 3 n=2 Tax=Tigriopus californicus TaxID=6832 RepID=A0A553N816_TIGCA|nr:hypothetical protein TCAL_04173 [Tigriopus californicus]|eukprot:TCALIF_04173-PA protein Name:"Similar to NDUFAF3 NADH dehydrogenase [ubiquinone] 1 alpha subcomplex assembly factor 3 (Bos taurus)" AED:0.56 eAED:0.56 QI:0/-1/0/1/-1/1/1/0/194
MGQPCRNPVTTIVKRHGSLRTTSESAAYDGPGKTTVSILNEENKRLMVDSFSVNGFRLNNNMKCFGPLVIFPTCVFHWALRDYSDLTAESLAIFRLLQPRPELVVVGYGNEGDTPPIAPLFVACKKMKLNVEFMTTENAIATYNYMCSEERLVAGALIPPQRLRQSSTRDDAFLTNAANKKDPFSLGKKDIQFH